MVVKDITMAKRFGQGSDILAWFWMEEKSESEIFFLFFSSINSSSLVYCVNWLRAKACINRWDKELTPVKHEMQWTTLWFQNQAKIWEERSKREDGKLSPGHRSYAAKQQKHWKSIQKMAKKRFK